MEDLLPLPPAEVRDQVLVGGGRSQLAVAELAEEAPGVLAEAHDVGHGEVLDRHVAQQRELGRHRRRVALHLVDVGVDPVHEPLEPQAGAHGQPVELGVEGGLALGHPAHLLVHG